MVVGCGALFGTPLTIDLLRFHRARGKWCVADPAGKYVLTVKRKPGSRPSEPSFSTSVKIYCSFVVADDIDCMVSYRWKEYCIVPENNSEIAINFRNVTRGRGRCWVDSLNHLNDPKLKQKVIENMGELYRSHNTVAEYMMYSPTTVKELFCMLSEATRAWMWQEVARNQTVYEFGSNAARMCLEVIRLGTDRHEKAYEGDKYLQAMTSAVEWCQMHGSTLNGMLERMSEQEFEDMPQFRDRSSNYTCLLDIPPRSVEMARRLVKKCNDMDRLLMSAAGNLGNGNIGSDDVLLKPDIVPATLSVISRMPKFDPGRSGGQEERYHRVFEAIRTMLLQSAIKRFDFNESVKYMPVPCPDRRVSDLFGLGITAVRWVTVGWTPGNELTPRMWGEPQEDLTAETLPRTARVQIARNGSYHDGDSELDVQVDLVHLVNPRTWKGEALRPGEEREVVSIAVSLHPQGAGAVGVRVMWVVTSDGLRLSFLADAPSYVVPVKPEMTFVEPEKHIGRKKPPPMRFIEPDDGPLPVPG